MADALFSDFAVTTGPRILLGRLLEVHSSETFAAAEVTNINQILSQEVGTP